MLLIKETLACDLFDYDELEVALRVPKSRGNDIVWQATVLVYHPDITFTSGRHITHLGYAGSLNNFTYASVVRTVASLVGIFLLPGLLRLPTISFSTRLFRNGGCSYSH
jgi:hypothetical protein